MIRKHGGGYRVMSHAGKKLGDYPTLHAAERRLKQIEMFKHMKGKKR